MSEKGHILSSHFSTLFAQDSTKPAHSEMPAGLQVEDWSLDDDTLQ